MCKENNANLTYATDTVTGIEIQTSSPKVMKPKLLPQLGASCAISMGGLHIGSTNGWSGGVLTQIDEEFHMNTGQLAFIVSVITVGSLAGSLFSTKLTDLIGRRLSLLFTTPLLFCGWAFIAFSSNIGYIYLGRLICGVAVGILLSTCNVYISEISSPEYRGRLGCINTLSITLGIMLSYTLAGFLTWRISCFCFIGFSVLMFLCVYFIPESPYWYLRKGRRDDAVKSIQWLRGPQYDITKELKEMLSKMEPVKENGNYKELFRRRTRIPLMIGLFTQVCQQLCGVNIIIMYTSVVFNNSNSLIDARYATMFTGILQIIGTVVSLFIIDRVGRKPILIISLLGVSVAMFVLGIGFHMEEEWPTWAPLGTILFCVFTFCLGLRSIPWLVSTELLNTSVRSTGTSICVFFNRILSLLTTQGYPYYRNLVGDEGVFFSYAVMSILLAVLTPYIVPETKNKTLEEIQEYFENTGRKTKPPKNVTLENEELV